MQILRGFLNRVATAFCLAGLHSATAGGENVAPFMFTLDGEPVTPRIISLRGYPERPAAGDVVQIDEFSFTLGSAETYNLKSTPETDGRLLLVAADGSTTILAANVGWTFEDRKVMFNPLAKMTEQEIRALRGVRLDEWPDGIDKALARIDVENCCVTVTDNTAQGKGKAFPPLPAALQYLNIKERSNVGIKDYGPLGTYASLRFLTAHTMTASLDVGLLKKNRDLLYLDLGGVELTNPKDLETFTQLRVLELSWARGVHTVAFATAMAHLRRLNLQNTAVVDLSPLAGLTNLAWVNADMSPVAKLPAGEMPALRNLSVMSTKLTDETVAEFRKANPACAVAHRWDALLAETLAGTTRIRVRSGGTCHRNLSREKTLFEEKGAEQIATIIANLKIDERESGFHCMCCGNPSFEFYKGDTLAVTLGFHHGRSLRWPDRWPADGLLASASAEFLVKWLAEHGVESPEEERDTGRKQQEAARRRMAAITKLLPADVLDGLKAAASKEEASKAFDKVADPAARAALAFKLLGCDNSSWNLIGPLDQLLFENVLSAIGTEALSKALGSAAQDQALANGAARWVFGKGKAASVDAKSLEAALPALAAQGLGHPRAISRRRTIRALGHIGGDAAIKLLRSCLASEIKVRPLPQEEAVEPGGMVEYQPDDGEIEEECSDGAYAALVLAKLGDKDSLRAIKALAGTADGADRETLGKALELLDPKK